MYLCIYVWVRVYVYMCTCVCMHICMHACIYIRIQVQAQLSLRIQSLDTEDDHETTDCERGPEPLSTPPTLTPLTPARSAHHDAREASANGLDLEVQGGGEWRG